MTKIEIKACLRAGAAYALVVFTSGILSTGVASAQNDGGVGSATPVYGIPPSANTQQALEDPRGVIEGIFSGFFASLGVAIARTDNVNRVPSPIEESDTITAFIPRLAYRTGLGRHQAMIEYTGFAERYQDFDNLDSVDNTLRGIIDFDFTEKLDTGIYARWADVNERRGTPGSQVLQIDPNEVEIADFGANLRYGTRAARHMQVRFGANVEDWRYQNNNQEFRDRDTSGAFGEIHYNVTGKTSIFLLGTYREYEYINANATTSDSEETTVQLGAEWQATSKTRGRVSIGQQDKDFKDPTVADTDTTTYNVRIRWQPKSYTGVNLYGSKRFEETNSPLDDFYTSTLWGIGVDHAFTSRWNGNVYYNNINDEYDSGQDDKFRDFGIGVNYLFRQWLSFGVRYAYIKRDSNIALNNYEENIFGFTLQLRYQRQ
jgi:hypothetical protein